VSSNVVTTSRQSLISSGRLGIAEAMYTIEVRANGTLLKDNR